MHTAGEPASPAPAGKGRVALGLVLFGIIELVHGIMALVPLLSDGAKINLLAPFSFLGVWLLAWLVWTDKRPVWAVLAYGSAVTLGSLAAGFLAGLISLPWKLISALLQHETTWLWFHAGYLGFLLALAAWLLWESTRAIESWRSSVRLPLSRWLAPTTFAAYAVIPVAAITWGILAFLQSEATRPATNQARQRHGEGFDYFVTNFNAQSANGHTRYQAEVIAYSTDELRFVPLRWEE